MVGPRGQPSATRCPLLKQKLRRATPEVACEHANSSWPFWQEATLKHPSPCVVCVSDHSKAGECSYKQTTRVLCGQIRGNTTGPLHKTTTGGSWKEKQNTCLLHHILGSCKPPCMKHVQLTIFELFAPPFEEHDLVECGK